MIYFTSDLHLGHRAILKMQDRPFESIQEMNDTLIQNINSIVHNNDKIYFLGDMAHHIPFEERNELIAKIHGRKYLIIGNHDQQRNVNETGYDKSLFEWILSYNKESLYGLNIVMCHYPMLSWQKSFSGSIMLHGHIHAGPEYNLENIRNGIKRFDVGVDANGFMPVSILTIKQLAQEADANRKISNS